jgi:uncharacterized secreted protein with C-terminal beta-propeller domain
MRTIAALLLAMAVATVVGSTTEAADARSAKASRLRAFDSCGQLLGYVKPRVLKEVGSYGIGLPTPVSSEAARASAPATAPVAGVDYSTTNVQEEGVDEPDLVKTNGSHLFVVRADRLFAVDVRGSRPRLEGSLKLEQGWSHELLLHGDRLLVLSRGSGPIPVDVGIGGGATRGMIAPYATQTVLTEVSVGDPSAMAVVRSLTLDADYVSARLVGASARVVTVSSLSPKLPFVTPDQQTPESIAAAQARNRALVSASRIGSWLPRLAVKGRKGETLLRRPLVECRSVRRPALYSGTGLLSVLTLDLKKGLAPIDSDAIVADGRTVYASPESLYVATQRWFAEPTAAGGDPPRLSTAVHKFDISDPVRTTYRGSGTVSGYLFSQWAMSEHDGVLRVASTEEPTWWNPGPQQESESFVTTLRDAGGGALAQAGRVGGLGKGERVYAVRFIGDKGYVVTFRQVDPLYTLDLSDPAKPSVLGELKIQGYSAYLHPLGEDLLLGIGQDADESGRVRGTQLSVFDVSDLRRPSRLHQWALGPSWSEAESDHHAFLWWPRERLAVLPVTAYDPKLGPSFSGAVGFRIGRATGIKEAVRVAHPSMGAGVGVLPVRRSLVVGDALYTVSDAGVQATGLRTFGDQGWVAFPLQQPAAAGSSSSP